MTRLVARRLALALPVLAVILVLDFALVRLGGGGGALGELGAPMGLSAETRARIAERHRARWRLDRPLAEQALAWGRDLVRLDLGDSMTTNRPVTERIARALPATLLLQGTALVLVFGLGLVLGVWTAKRARGPADRAVNATLLALHSTPVFWLATLGVLFLASADGLDIFPLEGLRSRDAGRLAAGARLLDLLHHMALPLLVLVLPSLAAVTRQVRARMIEVLASEHVRALRATGLPERRIVWRYALRNALGPWVTMLGGEVPSLIAGSIVVETIFGIDGMGLLLMQATFEHDYPVLQALFLFTAALTLLGYLASDVANLLLTPRTRDA